MVRIALFITCVNDTLYPGTGQAVVRLLRRLGHDVEFPYAQTCCGQMHFNSGYRRDAKPLVRGFVEAFEPYDAVVTPSGSCASMVREHYAELAAGRRSRALADGVAKVAPRVFELSEFLVDVLGVVDVGATFPHTVTYHPSCHSARLLRVGDRPERLLRAVRGLTLVDLPDAEQCCGFGGTFALKNAETSAAMGADKADAAEDSGAQVLCAGDNSCLMHIGGVLSRRRDGGSETGGRDDGGTGTGTGTGIGGGGGTGTGIGGGGGAGIGGGRGIRTVHLAEILASTGPYEDLPPYVPGELTKRQRQAGGPAPLRDEVAP